MQYFVMLTGRAFYTLVIGFVCHGTSQSEGHDQGCILLTCTNTAFEHATTHWQWSPYVLVDTVKLTVKCWLYTIINHATGPDPGSVTVRLVQ